MLASKPFTGLRPLIDARRSSYPETSMEIGMGWLAVRQHSVKGDRGRSIPGSIIGRRDMRRTVTIALLAFVLGNPLVRAGNEVGQPAVPDPLKREVSPEGKAYLQKLLKRIPFGANDFNLAALRAGMASRRAPATKDV